MAKIGENVSALIDKTVDFMASSQAFREYLNKHRHATLSLLKYRRENAQLYLQRLAYYRQLYRPQQEEK